MFNVQGTTLLDKEDNVLHIEGETVVVGDLHGQFFDLVKLLNTYGKVGGFTGVGARRIVDQAHAR